MSMVTAVMMGLEHGAKVALRRSRQTFEFARVVACRRRLRVTFVVDAACFQAAQ